MAHIITLANAKGGCGKTTVALNLAVCFARAGYRTLAIDLDQQGNLSAGLGVDLNQLNCTAHRLLINEAPEIRRYFIEIRPQLKLLPNTIDIEADDLLEAKKVNREVLLRRQLKPILPDFDVVLIDTPPAMRAATINALVVADSVIIPIDSSSFALLGMNQLLKTIAAISETHRLLEFSCSPLCSTRGKISTRSSVSRSKNFSVRVSCWSQSSTATSALPRQPP